MACKPIILVSGLTVLGLGVLLWANPTSISADELSDQALGYYTQGRLERPSSLSVEGHGYVQMARSRARARFYGTRELIQVLEETSADLANRYPGREPLRIGDLSTESGGQLSIHSSHQNGLDVDLLYLRRGKPLQADASPVSYQGLSRSFDVMRNWEYVKLLFATGKVSRVFVSPAVKYAYCQYARKRGEFRRNIEVLRRVQAYTDHASHFHVRLRCPEGSSPRCVNQADLPIELGVGCDAPPSDPVPAVVVPVTPDASVETEPTAD
jgi:penicillin-insensitive murein endopeptidase